MMCGGPRRYAVVCVLLALVLSSCICGAVLAKSYHYSSISITAQILPTGDMYVSDSRTYSFVGSYSWAQYFRVLSGADDITDIRVYDNSLELIRNDSQQPGTFSVERSGDRVTIRNNYSASNEIRTFTYEYTVKNCVVRHNDVGELYWKFIGDSVEERIDILRIEVFYPEGTSAEDIRVWAHGPLWGQVEVTESPSMLLTIAEIPAYQFVEARTTFPASFVRYAPRTTGKNALEDIIAEETRLADASNEIRDRLSAGEFMTATDIERELERANLRGYARFLVDNDPLIALGVLIAGLVFLFWIHANWNREFRPAYDGDYYRELPGEYSPSILGCLWNFGKPQANDFTAELLDLARHGFIRITEERFERPRVFGLLGTKTEYDYTIETTDKYTRDKTSLLPYQDDLLDLVLSIGNGKSVHFDDIVEYAKKNPARFQKNYKAWQIAAEAASETYAFIDHSTARGKAIGALISLAFIAAGTMHLLTMGGYFAVLSGIAACLVGGVILVFSLAMRRRTRFGSDELGKWQAFRNFLRDFSRLDESMIPEMQVWEHYLVYAVSLGVAKEVIDQLPLVFPELNSNPAMFGYGWLFLHSPDSFARLASFTNAMNTSMATAIASTPRSSGGGGGGGFSGGGGFGGGGGGSSAG